ncbi:MAG: S1 RNA-binding domain-containing protein [Ruminococcaceae bacterium]|nr:S1 RNA-binding domain-containing protein [Oscillospiraceae bacterium]
MVNYLPEGFLINTRENIHALSSYDAFHKAYTDKRQLEARAIYCDREHNLHIDFGFIHGIIPREECAIGIKEGTTRDIAIIARVNKPVRFVIDDIKISGDKKIAFLSRKKVQEEFQNQLNKNILVGDIITAKITHLESFGAFCDIGCGINALLPIDNISVSRIPHPNVRFDVGDDVKVIIKAFDEEGRATLTHKELLGTWEENAEKFQIGETVSGIVRSVESYGIFVELTPNLAGLAEYTTAVYEGQQTSVYIKSIIPEKMKVKLIIVDSFDADYGKKKPDYFIKEGHLDYFRYSPYFSDKIIETFF